MNELLDQIKPYIPTSDRTNALMIEQFKTFFLNFDIETINKWSMRYYDDYTDYFFHGFPYVLDERHLKVLGSVVGWLASNCGRCFIAEANALSEKLNSKHKGYVCAWALENDRQVGINNNVTLMENLLTPTEHHDHHRGLLCLTNEYVTSHDLETVNYLIHWLATDHGQSFLETAMVKVLALREEVRLEMQLKHFA